jgi:hypothetical protein
MMDVERRRDPVAVRQRARLEILITGGYAAPALLDLRLREETRSYPADLIDQDVSPARRPWRGRQWIARLWAQLRPGRGPDGHPAPGRRRSSARAACQILAVARHVAAWAGVPPWLPAGSAWHSIPSWQVMRETAERRRSRGLAAVPLTAGGEHAARTAPFEPVSVR